jgi:two-component system sensor histidine kinase/response regulator
VTDPSDAVAFIAFLTASGTITQLVSRVRKLMQEKLQQSEAYLSEAQRLSHTGSFGWRISGGELLTGELLWSEETFRIFQCDKAMKPTVGFAVERTHPDDTILVKETIEQAVKDGKDFDFEHRLLMPDGSVKHVHVVAHAKGDKPGQLEFVGAVMDVTNAKKAQEKLRESERRYAVTLSSIGDAVIATDDRACVTFMNRVAETLTAWKSADAIGRPITEVFRIINEDTRAVVEDPAAKVLRLGTVVGLANHTALLARDGRELPIDDCGSPIVEDDGKITGVVLVFRDMTQRRRAEEAELLRRSKERLELAVHGSNLSIWEFDMPDGRIENSRSTPINVWELLGYDPLTVPTDFATAMALVVHPEDLERLMSAMRVFLAGDSREFELEYRVRHKDGSERWRLTRGVVVRNPEGKPIQFIGTSVDITDLKKIEEALRKSEHRWRSITEALPQLVWTAMPDGACDYFSTQWTQYTGVPTSELLGWKWMATLHPDDREPTRQFWTDSVAERHGYDVEYRVRRFDGEYRWFKTRGVPIRDSDGHIFKWFGTCTDITDDKLAAEELRLAKEAAESANRAKDEFLANVSHEIRTPMNAIMGLTALVLGTDLNEGQRQSLATVKSAANNLLGIINDLLDFSKIEAGKLELSLGEFWLRATLADTLRALAVRAHQKGLELVSNVQSDVPDALIGDAGRLRQVLLNLIGNAIKFTEKGEVVIQVRGLSDAAPSNDEVHLLFTVRDTGIGIPREKQATIFRAFEQEDSSTTRKYGGTGLGLTISAQLAGLMGGKIDVESEPGQGSTFSFTARFGRSSKRGAAGAGESSDRLDNLRVLIVDDNVTNRQILEEWLRSWRMRPMAVGDGAAAVDALRQAVEAGAPYSLVLLDGRMPDGDGLTVARQIRAHVGVSSTRIILLPSDDSSISTARSQEMGINAYLLKPVQQSELLETISQVMGRTTPDAAPVKVVASTSESPAFPAPVRPLHILVAEDNEFNVILLKQLFGPRGHSAHIANNGREAVALATEGTFDLLLLDIHMPEMDGFAVAQAIREQERGSGKHLPIIAFTARTGKTDRERCLAAGMDDFLSKPVQAEALWEVIDRVVAARTPADDRDLGLLDPRVILGTCGGEAAILESICRTFQTSVPDQMARVRSAMNDNDAPRLREAAHLLRGTLSAFSTVADSAASNLEDEAARGQIEQCVPLVERLESICSDLVEQTRNLSIERLSGSG